MKRHNHQEQHHNQHISSAAPLRDPSTPSPSTQVSSHRITRSTTAKIPVTDPTPSNEPGQTTTLDRLSPSASRSSVSIRKRKAAPTIDSTEPSPDSSKTSRNHKRAKTADIELDRANDQARTPASRRKRATVNAMSSADASPDTTSDTSPPTRPKDSSRRKSSRRKSKEDHVAASSSTVSRKSRKGSRKDQDVLMKDMDEKDNSNENDTTAGSSSRNADAQRTNPDAANQPPPPPPAFRTPQEALNALSRDEDPFAAAYLSRFAGHSGLSNSLRALSGLVSGTHARLRNILEQLRMREDSSVQLIALQDLSELLLVSTEDNLAGHFVPDQFVKELVTLMQPNDFTGEENPEIMLLACRCIANLMEALPASTSAVVYGGAVPVLCQKLLEIHFIDLAEQALSTLEKISVEFPSAIVREGGLTACLTYLDFFATSTQRTAVTTAANCCRNIPEDSFATVRDVMPILLNTLSSNDQRVVEQASLCVSRVIDSFKYHHSKLEELISADLLKAILRLLLPGSTNMIGPNTHTQFLRVLSITARASPRLSIELLKLNVVDTLYQILTGVSPPSGTSELAPLIDKNIIMQSIIRTPREQIFETLNIICELLPSVSHNDLHFTAELPGSTLVSRPGSDISASPSPDPRAELLKECPEQVKHFANILFPTLMHAYTSTVNMNVRQKVLTAQARMLSSFDTSVLDSALKDVSYASYLASILSQQENDVLVTFALQAAELLLIRLENIYRPRFYREGVIAEISKMADRPMEVETVASESAKKAEPQRDQIQIEAQEADLDADAELDEAANDENDEENAEHDDDDDGDDDHEDNDDDEDDDDDQDEPQLDAASRQREQAKKTQDLLTLRAKRFMEIHNSASSHTLQDNASHVLDDIRKLGGDLKLCYDTPTHDSGIELFKRLATHVEGSAVDSITSYELMTSGIVDVLLSLFNNADELSAAAARADFLEVFMTPTINKHEHLQGDSSTDTPFGVLTYKLQELLSRSEHFEVLTVYHNASDSQRGGAASMLAKQLRLKLVADEDSGIPRPYRNIMVSIHAIATFKALDDYLRPRISLSERTRSSRSRDGLSSAMATYAAAMAGRVRPGIPALPFFGSSSAAQSAPNPVVGSNAPAETASSSTPGSGLRRSSRKRHTQQSSAQDSSTSDPGQENTTGSAENAAAGQEPIECADEKRLTEEENNEDEDIMDEDMQAELDALVGHLTSGGISDDEEEDPSAVNVEVAASGKVTAHTDDGAKIATPLQEDSQQPAKTRPSRQRKTALREEASTPPPSSASRQMSYASALQQPPQDWHIEFEIDGQHITSETTIYRACHLSRPQNEDSPNRNLWSTTHSIKFKRVSGPAPKGTRSLSPTPFNDGSSTNLPPSLDSHPITAGILRLMSILHDLNANLGDVVVEDKKANKLSAQTPSQFINSKLTAKLNRQLEEPLIVASECLPSWSEDLARLYPFLFPFETRHLFLQSTSFGYSRLMARWQGNQSEQESRHSRHRDERPFLGRAQRQKVRIARGRILESALRVLELYGSHSSILEVEYFEEVGTGLGPTLEFYSTVSREFSKKKLKLWRENESNDDDEFAFGKHGLFPAPMSKDLAQNDNGQRVLNLFSSLGKFVARSMLDSRIIDVSFNPTFFRIGDGASTVTPSLGAVAAVDQDLAKSLKMLKKFANAKQLIDEDLELSVVQKVEQIENIRINDASIDDLGLDFTLPGYPTIELQPHGASTNVTVDNVGEYVKKVIDFTLGTGVQRQVDAFRAGFSQVFPYSALRAFTPDELVMLFGRSEEDWSLETLMDSIKADHGYNLDSKSVRNLLQVMSELPLPARRDFLQFVTGSPKLPIGGFKSLTPMFTVVCKPSEAPYTSDDYLPSVMTCVNYLKMPDYSSLEMLRKRLHTAIREGQGAFHLS